MGMGRPHFSESRRGRGIEDMTPNEIEILIHCHVSPVKHPRADYPAIQEVLQGMETNGLIEKCDQEVYRTTDRGRAHVEQLCSLPWPALAWIDYKDEVIEI